MTNSAEELLGYPWSPNERAIYAYLGTQSRLAYYDPRQPNVLPRIHRKGVKLVICSLINPLSNPQHADVPAGPTGDAETLKSYTPCLTPPRKAARRYGRATG